MSSTRLRGAWVLPAFAVGLVLSDSSVVTLALPDILRELDATVSGVAWVLIAFNLALAAAAIPGWVAARGRPRAAFALACAGFAAASLACAAAPALEVLVAARAAQGVVGAILVAAALELLLRRTDARRAVGLWAAAGVLGAAVGPALGGFLTEAFSWEAMFALQAPAVLLALLGALGAARARAPASAGTPPTPPRAPADHAAPAGTAPAPPRAPAGRAPGAGTAPAPPRAPADRAPGAGTRPAPPGGPADDAPPAVRERPALAALAALALTSAALAAALFLLVILLIEGWRLSPGEAALVVTAMPLAALVAGHWARARHRLELALPGTILLAGGLAALGLLPDADVVWTIPPQLAIGAGLGLALGALIGDLAGPGRDAATSAADPVGRSAAWTVAARHAGIVAGLLILTPIFTADLEAAREPAQRAGIAHLLDAPISLKPKIALARSLSAQVQAANGQELPDLDAGFAAVDVPAADRAAVAALHDDLEDEIDRAATAAFSRAFLAAALLALLAAVAAAVAILQARPRGAPASSNGSRLAPGTPLSSSGGGLAATPSLNVAVPAACAVATLLVAAYVALGGAGYGPTPVADPCAPRERPVDERAQRVALATIDGAACDLGRGREELLLALLDREQPDGVSEDELSAALLKGIDRAEDEGELGSFAATGLRLAIRVGGALGIIGRLLPD